MFLYPDLQSIFIARSSIYDDTTRVTSNKMKRANSSNDEKPPGKHKVFIKSNNTATVSNGSFILPESVLFLQVGGFLHSKECMNLGELNKDYRQSFLPFRDESSVVLFWINWRAFASQLFTSAVTRSMHLPPRRVCTCGSNKKLDEYWLASGKASSWCTRPSL